MRLARNPVVLLVLVFLASIDLTYGNRPIPHLSWSALALTKGPNAVPARLKQFLGKKIQIAGFMVMLEGDEAGVSEFLLVPEAGMCVHVPPPPANQTVLVKMTGPQKKINFYWEPVIVTGIFSVFSSSNQFGESYFYLKAENVKIMKY